MQQPNFPNEIFGVVMSAGSKEEPAVRVTVIPARRNKSTISTINSRRIAMDKLGKIETIAESISVHIVRVWVLQREEIQPAISRMHSFMTGHNQKKLECLQKLVLSLGSTPIITECEYVD